MRKFKYAMFIGLFCFAITHLINWLLKTTPTDSTMVAVSSWSMFVGTYVGTLYHDEL